MADRTKRQIEVENKIRMVRELLEQKGLAGIYLKRQHNFAWLTAGGHNHVGIATEMGVAGLLITARDVFAVCNSIEAPRMAQEEGIEDLGIRIRSYPWYDERERETVEELCGGGSVGSDASLPQSEDISGAIAPLRWSLGEDEAERFAEVGRMTALAAEETAATVRPGETESGVVGRLAARLWADGMDYITIFCAADDRISRFRHPIATEKRIERRAMLCVNARKYGLIVSLTRFVQFEPVSAELRRKYDANVLIDCTFMANTIPGRPVRDAFEAGLRAYAEAGYPDEWKLHHQGGSIGYVGRDYKVNPRTDEIVRERQGFTWNPSITGAKSEDTMLATSEGPIMISPPIFYPALTLEVNGHRFRRPDILVK